MYKIRFRVGLRSRPHLRSLQRSPDPLAALKGPISKGRGGGGEGKRRRKGGLKKEFGPPNLHHRSTPLTTVRMHSRISLDHVAHSNAYSKTAQSYYSKCMQTRVQISSWGITRRLIAKLGTRIDAMRGGHGDQIFVIWTQNWQLYGPGFCTKLGVLLDWIEQGLTSPSTQYRLSGRRFLQVKTQATVSTY